MSEADGSCHRASGLTFLPASHSEAVFAIDDHADHQFSGFEAFRIRRGGSGPDGFPHKALHGSRSYILDALKDLSYSQHLTGSLPAG